MNRLTELYNKLFMSSYFFTIAISRNHKDSILKESRFKADFLMPATRKHWVADPILVEDQGNTYLFYEAVIDQKGRIEVVQVKDDCSVSQPRVILEDDCHYSYPFVFKIDACWYMIPESSASKEVRLYRAVEFPYRWEPVKVLLRQASVDTSVFTYGGKTYLQTFLLCPGCEQVIPQIYEFCVSSGEFALEQISWPEFDRLQCRGAGGWFEEEGALYRPAQENKDYEYGNAVLFYRLEGLDREYLEKPAGRLAPEQVEAAVWHDGLHTYTASEKFRAIDIRIRKFDGTKLWRILMKKCRKLQKR